MKSIDSIYRMIVIGCIVTAAYSTTQIPVLDWPGKRSDWVNVKTDVTPAAKGDGVTDDAAAIQAALSGSGYTIYFPPGTYRITTTLTTKSGYSQWFVGHGRTTVILWDGATGTSNRMMVAEGAGTSYWLGLTFDGNNKAGVGLDHDSRSLFETESNHRHCAFINLTSAGVRVGGGLQVQASAEMTIINCLFENCADGAAFYKANDYDNVIDGCEFVSCGNGITTSQGNYYIRNCHFEYSTKADISADNPMHPCSIRRCTSIKSNMFLNYDAPISPTLVQDCHISGWKNTGGALLLSGAPAVIFDCSFTNPPSITVIPIQSKSIIVHSNNTCSGVSRVIDASKGATEIPIGKRKGSITSANRHFLVDQVLVPQKIYDVKGFGAKGDGITDDLTAIQTAIDSARIHGHGSIAYLPRGEYKVTNSLIVKGNNYIVGGSGFQSRIIYRGSTGGVTMRIVDPKNVTVQQLAIGDQDNGGNNTADILHTGTGGNSSVVYDIIHVYGKYANDPFTKGLQLSGLPYGTKVSGICVVGNIRATNSSRATILFHSTWEGALVVEGDAEKIRDGFCGVLSRFNSHQPYGLFIKNNQNFVGSDYYTESSDRYWSIDGGTANTMGHVTVMGVKVSTNQNPSIDIKNYQGRITALCLQYMYNPNPRQIVHTGTRPVDMVFIANKAYEIGINISIGSKARLNLIGNEWSPGPVDTLAVHGLNVAAQALDDLREQGDFDLMLYHGNN